MDVCSVSKDTSLLHALDDFEGGIRKQREMRTRRTRVQVRRVRGQSYTQQYNDCYVSRPLVY